KLSKAWRDYLASGPEGISRTIKDRIEWLNKNQGLRAELVEVAGEAFKPDSRDVALTVAKKLGFVVDEAQETEDEKGRGPAKHLCVYQGHLADAPEFRISSIQTRRVSSKPGAPFI